MVPCGSSFYPNLQQIDRKKRQKILQSKTKTVLWISNEWFAKLKPKTKPFLGRDLYETMEINEKDGGVCADSNYA